VIIADFFDPLNEPYRVRFRKPRRAGAIPSPVVNVLVKLTSLKNACQKKIDLNPTQKICARFDRAIGPLPGGGPLDNTHDGDAHHASGTLTQSA
jgi:hypothetical protein